MLAPRRYPRIGGSSQVITKAPTHTVVLVEGNSDRGAIEALSRRRGRDLASEGIEVVAMGGAKNITTLLRRYGPGGLDLRLAGLCDAGEEVDFRRGLERAGFGADLSREEMEQLGFFVCVADLEDELIRSIGVSGVEAVIEARGETGPLQTFRKQPEWRDRAPEEQLRRFFGTHSGRKIGSAPLLVEALDPGRVPRPLEGLLASL
jgi:hypothetical protein